MHKGETFVHPHTGKNFEIKHFLTCNSEWIIYVLWCPGKLLYVGETTCSFKTRMNNTFIRKARLDLPVAKYFTGHHNTEWDLRAMIVDHIQN